METEEGETFPTSSCEANIQSQTKASQENYRSVFLMNINTKILDQIPANQIQQHIERTVPRDQEGLVTGSRGWFNIREPMRQTTLIEPRGKRLHKTSQSAQQKALDKIQPFMTAF